MDWLKSVTVSKSPIPGVDNPTTMGAFQWRLHKCTIGDAHKPYESFEAAPFGEFQMKVYLAKASGLVENSTRLQTT